MARPHISTHASVETALRYARATEGEVDKSAVPMAATVPLLPLPQAVQMFEGLARRTGRRVEWVMITLSLPPDRELDRRLCHALLERMFAAFGVPGGDTPWECWAHRNTRCGHFHLVAGMFRFDGALLRLQNREQLCDRADMALSRFLGVPHFAYPELVPISRTIPVPRRRARRWNLEKLEEDLAQMMRVEMPDDAGSFLAAADRHRPGGCTFEQAYTADGVRAWRVLQPTESGGVRMIWAGRVSPHLRPAQMRARFAHVRRLTAARNRHAQRMLCRRLGMTTIDNLERLRRLCDDFFDISTRLGRTCAAGHRGTAQPDPAAAERAGPTGGDPGARAGGGRAGSAGSPGGAGAGGTASGRDVAAYPGPRERDRNAALGAGSAGRRAAPRIDGDAAAVREDVVDSLDDDLTP